MVGLVERRLHIGRVCLQYICLLWNDPVHGIWWVVWTMFPRTSRTMSFNSPEEQERGYIDMRMVQRTHDDEPEIYSTGCLEAETNWT